jgi:hypothetical protein
MKNEFRVALIFGLVQLLLSVVIWGSFEYSIMSGDMVQSVDASFWTFVFGERLISYIGFSVANMLLFGVFATKFRSMFHPGVVGAVFVAVGTVALAIPLLLNSIVKVPYLLISVVAFLAASTVYGLVSKVTDKRKLNGQP